MKRYNSSKGTYKNQNQGKKAFSLSIILWLIPLAVSGYLLYKSPNLLKEVKDNKQFEQKKEEIRSVLNKLQKEKTQDNIVIASSTPRVFFCQVLDNHAKLVAFKVELSDETNQVEEILNKLLNPPQGLHLKYQSLIPQGTRVNQIEMEGQRLILDLTEDFLKDNYGKAGKRIKVAQLISTLTSLSGINEVELKIDGEKTAYLDRDGLIKNRIFKALDIEYRIALD